MAAIPTLKDVLAVMDGWFDPRWAEPWDAVGLVCGDPDEPVTRIHLALDPVPATVGEAIDSGAQLLITHHPLLLTGVHGVPADDPKGALVHRMIRAGTAHLVAHTNADVADPGVSDALGEALGLTDLRALEPADDLAPDELVPAERAPGQPPRASRRGAGRIGRLPTPVSLREFTRLVAERLPATVPGVRAAGDPDRVVQVVAVAGGSGGGYADAARDLGADVLVTADVKHHHGVETVTEQGSGAMALVDATHWATEAPWLDALARRLTAHFGTTVDVSVSRLVTDPWTVHAGSPGPAPER